MTQTVEEKLDHLKTYLADLGSVAVAFSSGVDSTLLLSVAHEVLGSEKVVAVTARSRSFPERELNEAVDFCRSQGIRQVIFESDELSIEGFRQNPVNRCYLCKRELFEKILDIAHEQGMDYVVEGSNVDDLGDYRPGLQAIAELGIKSPLREAGLSKAEIRELSQARDLPTWSKPSFACLASRFVYGETIDDEKLDMVDKAEQLLLDLGFHQVRVRIHGLLARIEVSEEELPRLVEPETRARLTDYLTQLGFTYVTLDLKGYRTGSMNLNLD